MGRIWLGHISDVSFGTAGTIVIQGKDRDGDDVEVVIANTDIGHLAPRLMQAATIALYSEPTLPPQGTSVSEMCFVTVVDGHAFAAKDTKEPCLTLHTSGGTVRFHFQQTAAIKCGKELHEIALAAAVPDQSRKH